MPRGVGGSATSVTNTNLDIRDLNSATDSVEVFQATASNLNAQVVGNVASAATDSGNPVKTAGKYNSSPITLTNGQRGDTQVDVNSNTLVSQGTLLSGEDLTNTVLGVAQKPVNSTTYTPTVDDSAAYEASSVSKNAAGILHGAIGYNSASFAQWILFFNSTTVPADATVPITGIFVDALSPFVWTCPSRFSKSFATGIAWSNSLTGPTKTIGAANCWVNVDVS